MEKVVFDTNVIVGAAIASGPCFKLLEEAEKKSIILYVSEDILHELEETLKKLNMEFTTKEISLFVRKIRRIARMIKNPQTLRIVKEDPDDDKILGCAIAAKADYLITGDHHLLNLKKFKQVKVVKVKEFIEMMVKEQKF